jgi:hypothetical protein
MTSLDRYLKEIRGHLPAPEADDIINELGENLRAQIEDRESELERPLTDEELEALLNAHGKPLVVASRYRPEQLSFTFGRQLIGPALFPSYTRVLGVNLSITAVVILVRVLLVATGNSNDDVFSTIAFAFLIQFGVVTAIFVAADRMVTGEGSFGSFETPVPKTDRPLLDRISDNLIGKEVGPTVPRRTSVTDLALSVLLVGWLIVIRPPVEFGFLRSGPGWESFMPFLYLVGALMAVQPIVNLARPDLVVVRGAVRTVANAAMAAIFVASLRVGEWVQLTEPVGASSGQRMAERGFNDWIGVSLTVISVLSAVLALLELRRLWLARSRGVATAGAVI